MYQFEDLVDNLDIVRDLGRNPLFDVSINLLEAGGEFETNNEGVNAHISNPAKFDLSFGITEYKNTVQLNFNYCTKLFKPETIERFANYFLKIISEVKLDTKLSDIEIITSEEKQQILYDFNDTYADYPKDKTIHQLFEEQVERTPDNIALVFEDRTMTYRELNEKANQLAWYLVEKGVEENNVIALIMDRSCEMIISILAILKSGNAYLPLDPSAPLERLVYQISNSKVSEIITNTHSLDKLYDYNYTNGKVNIININKQKLSNNKQNTNLNKQTKLAYVIYTSGTTGKPKGTIVEHSSIVNTIVALKAKYLISSKDVFIQVISYVFDAFLSSLFPSLLSGAKNIIIPSYKILNMDLIKEILKNYEASNIVTTPKWFSSLLSVSKTEHLKSLKKIIFGGESIDNNTIDNLTKILPEIEISQEYGVTEASTTSTLLKNQEKYKTISIGKPISNTQIYILDTNYHLLPIGVSGELCIAGDGLAVGYLNRPKLTKEKFIWWNSETSKVYDEETKPESAIRIYKTGDLARWLPDGNIEFLGRIDHQVKIRGFRIELGEIENQLSTHKNVTECVVIDKEDDQGQKYLVAYYVKDSEEKLETSELRQQLSKSLPDYMIPAYFMELDSIPLTSNGKINRKALPKPEIEITDTFVAPSNEVEEQLVQIWSEVLKIDKDKISVTANFFEIGGDSIKAIQISSRLLKAGYKISVKDLFTCPSITLLKHQLKEVKQSISQEAVSGKVELTPIQHWFFQKESKEKNHFNQSVMLYNKAGFNDELIQKAISEVIIHHDALRMIYRQNDQKVDQVNQDINSKLFDIEIIDLKSKKDENVKDIIEKKNTEIQTSIDIENGPLVKLGLFKTDKGDHLLIAIHHLVVDGVSWRIILEDINIAYTAILDNNAVSFQLKTNSFKEWTSVLKEFANSSLFLKEIDYWKNVENVTLPTFPIDYEVNEKKHQLQQNSEIIELQLDKEYTQKLLTESNQAYNSQINDLLLTALIVSLSKSLNIDKVAVNLEGHGREQIIDDIDISRTVGWFTSQYPVILTSYDSLSLNIKQVKETLRRVPNNGIGYSILKYLTLPENKKDFETKIETSITFNYLGEFFDNVDPDNANEIGFSKYSSGESISKQFARDSKLDLNGLIIDKQLVINFSYNKFEYNEETMKKVAYEYESTLKKIIDHCASKEVREITASDVGYPALELEEFGSIQEHIKANFNSKTRLSKIYNLNPMQEGMLFTVISESSSSVYFEQNELVIEGEIEIEILHSCFQKIIERYDILRTIFIHNGLTRPVQVVLENVSTNFNYYDISKSEDVHESYVHEFKEKDKNQVFNLDKELAQRFSLIKIAEKKYHLIWSSHHILMDGWCLSILFNDLISFYQAKIQKEKPQLPSIKQYSEYIGWLDKQDYNSGLKYWQKYLENYEQVACIDTLSNDTQEKVGYKVANKLLEFNASKTNEIVSFAKRQNITLNVFLQTVWGILLHKINNTDDVVFGVVTSGRPEEIGGIDTMIGLFINTIPQRITATQGKTFKELLQDVHKSSTESKSYEYLPLASIQSLSALKNNLINHIFVFENYPVEERMVSDNSLNDTVVPFKIIDMKSFEQTNYDLNIIVAPGKKTGIKFSYNKNKYSAQIIERVVSIFSKIVNDLLANPDTRLSDIEIITSEEKQQILYDFNDTYADYPKDKTIHQLFEEQVERTPDNIALVFEDRTMTYRELNEKANQLAWYLVEQGVKPGDVVGLLLDKSFEMIISILGILKAGGAYLPLDPSSPEDRIKFQIEDSKLNLIITNSYEYDNDLQISLKALSVSIVNVNEFLSNKTYKSFNLQLKSLSNSLAYIIYTSGTTGKPKGGLIKHCNIVNTLCARIREYEFNDSDTSLQLFSYTFDGFVTSFFTPLLSGTKCILINKEEISDPKIIDEIIKNHNVTSFIAVPSLFNQLVDSLSEKALKSLEKITLAGEKQNQNTLNHCNKQYPQMEISNEYGVTEASVMNTINRNQQSKETISIGKPISNTKIYILDTNYHLLPIGVPGELCIAGDGLAVGYLNRPELTKEKFVWWDSDTSKIYDEETKPESAIRIYKTGDLARWLPDGNIEFLGRIDHQVKIRGFRIELGEIENQLLTHKNIKECVVIDKEDDQGQKYLVAYYVKDKKASLETSELRQQLAKHLPDYMIPAYFMELDSIPLTSNGKINRKSLPKPEIEITDSYVSPSNEIEEQLVEIWSEVLKLDKEKISVTANFFEIGGNSLKVITLVAEIHKKLEVKIEISDLLKNNISDIKLLSEKIKLQQFVEMSDYELKDDEEEFEL
jgi:bacitracin synthase 3